jgi:hypothetical protein
MDRVSTLLNKLQNQLDENSTAREMLQTVQILQAELIKKVEKKQLSQNQKISVLMPVSFNIIDIEKISADEGEAKVVQVLQVNDKDIEEQLQQIKKNAESAG